MVNTANPVADRIALALPIKRPADTPLITMMAIPSMAIAIATQVAGRTASRRMIQPSIAARNGAEANRNMALATVVVWMAYIPPVKANTRPTPPMAPARPARRIVCKGRMRERQLITTNRKAVNAIER